MATANRNSSTHRKLALIIGNGTYVHSYNRLKQSVNNARDLGSTLSSIGFQVTTVYNLSKNDMTTRIIEFANSITRDDMILFYFSGHCYQVNGDNYLLPVDDIHIKSDDDMEGFAVNFELIIMKLVERSLPFVTVSIIDCYRPYAIDGSPSRKGSGLQQMNSPKNTFITFACDNNQRGSDHREIDRNSLYTNSLLKYITKKNVDIGDLLQQVADEVRRTSLEKQRPVLMNGLCEHRNIYFNEETININDSKWDERTEGSFELEKAKQAKLKEYYDDFEDIKEMTREQALGIEDAQEFTNSILRNLPSGDPTERNTACHVLASMLESRNTPCLFFDSTHGSNLNDASSYLAEIESQDKPFVLKLNSSEGLGGSARPKTEQGQIRLVREVCQAIEQRQPHAVVEDIRQKLAQVYEVDKKDILVRNAYYGSFNVVFMVKKWKKHAIELPKRLLNLCKLQFPGFISMKIHPLLNRPAFDVSYFDERGNKRFPSQSNVYDIGPHGNTRSYVQPGGFVRLGLNVLGRYKNGDAWLEPFGDSQNWYRAYHGTKNASKSDFKNSDDDFDPQYACVDAMAHIYAGGFRRARTHYYGSGVYCSPDPKYTEGHYAGSVAIDTTHGKQRYICMLQVAVNPYGVTFTANDDIWLVPKPEDIRSYGILVKEI